MGTWVADLPDLDFFPRFHVLVVHVRILIVSIVWHLRWCPWLAIHLRALEPPRWPLGPDLGHLPAPHHNNHQLSKID